MSKVIDLWPPIPAIPEVIEHLKDNFPKEMLGYLRIMSHLPPTEETVAHFLQKRRLNSTEEFIALMDAANIERALITGFDEFSSVGKTLIPNSLISPVAQKYPDRFIPFVGVDILKGKSALEELTRLVKEEGFKGLSLRPFMIGILVDDRRYYPFYEKCIELDIPLSIHASANWSEIRINEFGHPRHFDQVACDFPELRLILSHACYPWILEAVLLAWKHPNVYLELSAHRPKYLAMSGTGWEPLFRFGETSIQDKVLYGTGFFLLGRSPKELINEFRSLPLSEMTQNKWLYENAKRLLKL